MRWRPIIGGSLDISVLLSFVFGVVFITVMLIFAVFIPNPSPFAQWVFIIVVALSAAGVGAVVPGILNIEMPYVRAGGALALFAVIFFMKPAIIDSVAKLVPPQSSPMPAMQAYLERIDARKLDEAWDMLDGEAKRGVARDRDAYRRVYAAGRDPLGPVQSRVEMGLQEVRSPSGWPIGIYRIVGFRTRFATGQCHLESVAVRATDDNQWRVYEHNVNPIPIPCLS